MNKYQEAIMLVRERLNTAEPNVMNHLAANRKLDHELQELVEKATPKKPKIRTFNEAEPWDCADYLVEREACPLCGRKLLDKDPYCYICGQAIDWSTDD